MHKPETTTVRWAALGSLLIIGTVQAAGCSAGSSNVPGSSLGDGGMAGAPSQATGGASTGGATATGGVPGAGGEVGTGGAATGGSGSGCTGTTTQCGTQCVDLSQNSANCGSCGHACPSGQACSNGACGCTSGTLCGSTCANLASDGAHCGACGNACTSGQVCTNGSCVCTSGSFCGSTCVNTQIDASNCGSCGHVCTNGMTCAGGSCGCTSPDSVCSNACVNLQTSNSNCGSCGHACPSGQSCSAGACTCNSGTLCGSSCVNTQTDAANCGACGKACGSGQSCSNSACACSSSSQTLCGTTCVNTQTDAANCGSCGHACSTGQTCSAGACTGGGTTCPPTNALIGWATQSGGTTGGGSATSTTVTSLSALNSAAGGTTARVIVVSGTISGDVTVGSNKTIMGACGGAATIKGHIQMSGSKNVILRNLNVVGYNCTDSPSDCSAGADAITIESSAAHIWIDHCDISDGSDGNTDITHASDYISVSWTKFHYSGVRSGGHQFSNLIGHSASNGAEDTGHLRVTFHHVWWADHVDQRQPRVRFGQVHVFDSLYTATGNTYCVGVGADANILLENSVFIGVKNPIDTNDVDPTSASVLESNGNVFTNTTGSRSAVGSGNAFTPPYAYTLDAASSVQSAVQSGAGPK